MILTHSLFIFVHLLLCLVVFLNNVNNVTTCRIECELKHSFAQISLVIFSRKKKKSSLIEQINSHQVQESD